MALKNPTPPTDDNPYLRAALNGSLNVSPEFAAESARLSKSLSLPQEVVSQWPGAKKQALIDHIDTHTQDTPVLRTQYTDKDFASIAQDDVENLSMFEKTARTFSNPQEMLNAAAVPLRGLASSVPALAQGFYGGLAAMSGTIDKAQMEDQARQTYLPKDYKSYRPFKQLEDWSLRAAQAREKEVEAVAGPTKTYFGSMVQGASQSIGMMLPGLIATVATDGEAAPLMIIPGVVAQGGQSAQKGLEKGLPADQALRYGAQDAAFEYMMEKIPVGALVGDLHAGSGLFKTLWHQVITEVPTEVATTLAQNFDEWANINPDKPFTEFLKEQPQAIQDTIVQTLMMSGTVAGVGHVVHKAHQAMQPHEAMINASEGAAETFKGLNDIAQASKTLARSPETFEAFAQSALEGHPTETTYVHPDRLMEVADAQGLTPEQLTQMLPSVASQQSNFYSGTDLAIPTSELISKPDLSNALLGHVKFSPDMKTLTEVKTMKDETEAKIRDEISKALEGKTATDEFKASLDKVHAKILSDLKDTQAYDKLEASANARLQSEAMGVYAMRLGMTPEAFYKQYGAKIMRGASMAAPASYSQITRPQPDENGMVTLHHWGMSPDLTESDPTKWGENSSALSGSERNRIGVAPGRTYFGLHTGEEGGYVKEFGTGDHYYTSQIPANKLYDAEADPLNLRGEARDIIAGGAWKHKETASLYENLIKEAGYSGYWLAGGNVRRGLQAAVFDKLPLQYQGVHKETANERRYAQSADGQQTQDGGLPGSGQLRGSTELLDVASGPYISHDKALTGQPGPVEVPGRGKVSFGPFRAARVAAARYMASRGWVYSPPTKYVKVDKERATKIAQAFEDMAHDPNDPEVKASYRAMIDETLAQWQAIKATGLQVSFINGPDPYKATPRLAILDVVENNHLWVFPTDDGFGGSASADIDISGNPLLELTDEYIDGKQLRANDVFRIVHDYFGHIKEGAGFRAEGEENAWQSHAAMFSPLARRAMTTETRGQNSWVNFGPYAEFNKTASAEETQYAPQKIGLLPEWVSEEGFEGGADSATSGGYNQEVDRISTRLPSTKGAKENAISDTLSVGLEPMTRNEKALAHNAEILKEYPGFTTKASTPEKVIKDFVDFVKGNLSWLYDQVPEGTRPRSSLWYDGAHKIANDWADKYDVPPRAVAAVLAALSPQKDWYQNVSLAERVLDIAKFASSHVYEDKMAQTAARIFAKEQYQSALALLDGKSYADLTAPDLKAMWLRIYDETYNPRGYRTITPEGNFVGEASGNVAWGSNVEIAKAVQALDDPSRESISALMGSKHKVRSFYNNIIAPNSPDGDVTIDTHAVAAALLRPLSGSSGEVHHNFGSSPGKDKKPEGFRAAKSAAEFGIEGTYGIYADAYRLAAKEKGVLPRQLQSITWEAVRGLFPAKFKQNKKNIAAIDAIWAKHENGELSLDETRSAIEHSAGGVTPPTWEGSHTSGGDQGRASSYDGKLADQKLARRSTGGVGAGDGHPTGVDGGFNQSIRGQYNPSSRTISLTPNADSSTFIHETGHYFLDLQEALVGELSAKAASGEALTPGEQGIVDDFNTLLKWFDIKGDNPVATWSGMSLDEKRDSHEKFARGFEAYLFEGKAPNTKLARIFARLSALIKTVYQSLTELNVQLSDEVRGVMGRMLASEETIKKAEQAREMQPLFKDAASAGMTPEQWAEYQAQSVDATDEATAKLQTRSLRDMQWLEGAKGKELRKLQRDVEGKRKAIKDDVTKEVMAEPVNKAREILKSGTLPDGTTLPAPLKMDKTEILLMTTPGDPKIRSLEFLKGLYVSEGGLHPDIIAEMAGFQSGLDMLHALTYEPAAADKIKQLTDERTMATYGDLKDPERLSKAADEAIHSEAHDRFVATEYSYVAEAAKVPRADQEVIKAEAERQIGDKLIKDLKPNVYMAAATRYANEALKTFGKGDVVGAANAKLKQLINTVLSRVAIRAAGEMEAMDRAFRKIMSAKDDNLAKSRDMNIVYIARYILTKYGYGTALQSENVQKYLALIQEYDAATYASFKDMVDAAEAEAKPLTDISINTARDLRNVIMGLMKKAKDDQSMVIAGQKVHVDAIKDALKQELVENGAAPKDMSRAMTDGEKRGQTINALLGKFTRVEALFRGLGNAFSKYIFTPVSDANTQYLLKKAHFTEKLANLFKAIEADLKPIQIVAPELGYTFTGRLELLHAILHTGNESNKTKLLVGRGWGEINPLDGSLDATKWDDFMRRITQDGTVSEAHLDFCQGVWDLLEEIKPLIQKAHHQQTGRFFTEVEANGFQAFGKDYRGGYVPAIADPNFVPKAGEQAAAEAFSENPANLAPTTASGFTKSRSNNYNAPLALNLKLLTTHIDKTLRYAIMQPVVSQVSKILHKRDVAKAMHDYNDQMMGTVLAPWLKRSVTQVVETPPDAGGRAMANFMSVMRLRAGLQFLAGNIINAGQQLVGFFPATVAVKSRYLAKAMVMGLAAPGKGMDNVRAMSDYMKTRTDDRSHEIRSNLNEILVNAGLWEKTEHWMQKHAYVLQQFVAHHMEPVIWQAAYAQASDEGMLHDQAVRHADSVIRLTQEASRPVDISDFQVGSAGWRLMTQFSNYFNVQANLLGSEAAMAKRLGMKKGLPRMAKAYFMIMVAAPIAAQIITQLLQGGQGDDNDDGVVDLQDYLRAYLSAVFRMHTAAVPIAGGMVNTAVDTLTNYHHSDGKFTLTPVESMLQSSLMLATGKEKAGKATRDAFNVMGLMTGMPLGAVGRPAGYAAGVMSQDVTPTGPVDAARGAVTGTPSPQSKNQ